MSPTIGIMDLDQMIIEASRELCVTELKPKQHEAIPSYVSGHDSVLPTGYGKSLIYAVLPLVFDKLRGIDYFLVSFMVLLL